MKHTTLSDKVRNRVPADDAPAALTTRSGARAMVEGGDTVRVYSPTGSLVFEYDADTRTTRVVVPDGDLEFLVPEGAITLASRNGVQVRTDGPVGIRGSEVRLDTPETGGGSVRVSRQAAEVDAPTVRVRAERAETQAAQARLLSRSLEASVDTARITAKRMDTWSERWRMRADELHQEVKGTFRLSAERVVGRVRDTYRLAAERLRLRAEKDVRVDGERIDLG